jgi:hypothetical protein
VVVVLPRAARSRHHRLPFVRPATPVSPANDRRRYSESNPQVPDLQGFPEESNRPCMSPKSAA